MADTPEQRLRDMAQATAEALGFLDLVLTRLPIPVQLPRVHAGVPLSEMTDALTRIRTLIDDEPIEEHLKSHIDQATLGILMAMDLLKSVGETGDFTWKEDALFMICTTSLINLQLTLHLMGQDDQE